MRLANAIDVKKIVPPEVREVLGINSGWAWILLGTAIFVGLVEAATLTTLLLLGYAILGEEPTGLIGNLLGGLITPDEYQRDLFQKDLMGRIISSPLRVYDEKQMGEILHDLMNGPQGVIVAIDNTGTMMSAVFLIVSVAIMLAVISPWLLLVALGVAFIWFVTMVPPLQRRVQRYQKERYDRQSDGTKTATNAINGIREIRSLSAEQSWVDEFGNMVDDWENARGKLVLIGTFPTPALQGILQSSFGLAIVFAAVVLSSGDLVSKLPVLAAFAYGLFRVYPLMGQLSATFLSLAQSVPNLRAAKMWFEQAEDPLAGGTEEVCFPIKEIRFDDVSFSYHRDQPVLFGTDFRLSKGKVTALVGSSGAGKSTLIDILLKFRSPSSGILRVGEQDLNNVLRSSWLANVGLVRQDVFLFSGSIKDNLLTYQPDATEEDMRFACKQAGILDFIDTLSKGFDTEVGERGLGLSGGQRQRLAIARAFIRKSEILIFDEAMSALDGETESAVFDSLLSSRPDRMILLVSHRWATVKNADNIVVLDGGCVVEQGTNSDLINLRGRYWELFATQFEEDIESTPDFRGYSRSQPMHRLKD